MKKLNKTTPSQHFTLEYTPTKSGVQFLADFSVTAKEKETNE